MVSDLFLVTLYLHFQASNLGFLFFYLGHIAVVKIVVRQFHDVFAISESTSTTD